MPLSRTFSSFRLLATAATLFAASVSALSAQETAQRPQITGVAHIALTATSMDAARQFYTRTLGWKAVASPEYPKGMRFYGTPRQTVEVSPAAPDSKSNFEHIAWAVSDAEAMRLYLKGKGVKVPAAITTLSDGEQIFQVKDPEGNTVEFAQLQPDAATSGEDSPDSISGRIIHGGFIVHSAAAEDAFYKDILGFHLYWMGGMKDTATDFVSMQVPDGHDWVEYMLNNGAAPSHRQMGVSDHFALGVADIQTVATKLSKRGWTPTPASKVQMGRDGKYQLNLYDPDQTRVEFMQFTPSQTPCCHPISGQNPGPGEQ